MKTSRLYFLITIVSLASMLTACVGGSGTVANSWPGVTVDAERQVVYLSFNTYVHAIDLTNGTQKWRFPGKKDKQIFFAPAALTEDGQVIVGGYDNVLYSLQPITGTQTWAYTDAKDRFTAAPLAYENMIFAPASDNILHVLDLAGNSLWKFETQHFLWSTPATDGTCIYLSSMDHSVYALDIKTGAPVWKTADLGGSIASQPVLSEDGVLYVGTFGSEMLALEASSGKVLWRTPTTGWVWSSPVLKDGVLYFGDMKGALFALSAADGTQLWKFQVDEGATKSITGTPAIVGDTLYFVTEGSLLYALDLASGNARWDPKTLAGKLYAGPYVAGDLLLIPQLGVDDILIALDINGNQRWSFKPEK